MNDTDDITWDACASCGRQPIITGFHEVGYCGASSDCELPPIPLSRGRWNETQRSLKAGTHVLQYRFKQAVTIDQLHERNVRDYAKTIAST